MQSYRCYVQQFEDQCASWSNDLKGSENEVVFNNGLKSICPADVKYIVVGDNPGKKEVTESEYLVGDAGMVARLFFERFLIDSFDKEVVVLNKTPISTPRTGDLESLHKVKCQLYINSQRYMADLVYNLSNILDVPVIVMGFAGCRKNDNWNLNSEAKEAVGIEFFRKLKSNFYQSHNDLYIIKHFSRSSFFSDFDIDLYRSSRVDVEFFKIGKKYSDELMRT